MSHFLRTRGLLMEILTTRATILRKLLSGRLGSQCLTHRPSAAVRVLVATYGLRG